MTNQHAPSRAACRPVSQWRFPALLSLIFLVTLAGCAPKIESYPLLVNQGILPLSSSNPYLGSNLFIARESEKSSYLFNFLKGRGAPAAIQIEQGQISSPVVVMFYPRDREVYRAQLESRPDRAYQWIVTGPFAIARNDYRRLAETDAANSGEPLFVIRGQQYRFKFQRDEAPQRIVIPAIPPPPPPPVVKKPVKKPAQSATSSSASSETPAAPVAGASPAAIPHADYSTLNSDQRALLIAQGYAERSPTGDVIHAVKAEGESLTAIAKWYTGNESYSASIAQASGVSEQAVLAAGQRLVIPIKIATQLKAMPAPTPAQPPSSAATSSPTPAPQPAP